MKYGFLFPGQGVQAPQMFADVLKAHSVARDTLAEVDDALGFSLSKLIANGPTEELTLTANAQPAIMAVGVACHRVLQHILGFDPVAKASLVAGHSLGEWSALVATKSLALADCARLLRLRGESMQKAVPVGKGAMVAILGGDATKALANSEAVIANDNCKGQVVISGPTEAVAKAAEKAKATGAKAIPLKVSVPFHSPLMEPVVAVLAEALGRTEVSKPIVDVVSNVNATAQNEPEEIKMLLAIQAKSQVKWRQTLEYMAQQNLKSLFEMAPGAVLSGLVKRALGDTVESISMRDLNELEAAAQKLSMLES